ncbi:uncharacterized protein LOC131619373 [Vicia villosa]|uniref:uncharacterized protein LOC131619373 n=1 Tax=Vicia villosa TaxID=3911 RepID=UPI00273AF345|nr:uncharacterized protein LOC131619373 [Vicia villosa]
MRLIRELFSCVGAEAIIHVPLIEDVTIDRLVWKDEKDGEYSVRSGYRVWKNRYKLPIPEPNDVNWIGLWSIFAPPRVKHLLWRICSGCLPSRVRLSQHHVPCPLTCQFCGVAEEDDCKEDRKVVGRFAMMVEILWHNRNEFIWNNEKEEASRLGWLAFHKWQEWWLAQNSQDDEMIPLHIHQWIPSPPEAEALALKEAIQGALVLHLDHVVFASDSQQVVQAIHSNSIGGSEFSFIIRFIKLLLLYSPNFEFGVVVVTRHFRSIPRAANLFRIDGSLQIWFTYDYAP